MNHTTGNTRGNGAVSGLAGREMRRDPARRSYVLVTAAYNEDRYIENTIKSVVAQTELPLRWAIVSDGSTDRTDEIVLSYAARYPFIQLVRVEEEHARNFAAQVHAINLGCKSLQPLNYRLIANLDSDITFEPEYYSRLIDKFDADPNLGLAGGDICELHDGKFVARSANREYSVAHAVQMFRRECFDGIGGYHALPYGGPDWHAQVVARMQGWGVKAFPDLPVCHHRPTGTADRIYRHLFKQGRMDYSLGSYPPFEVLKLVRRFPNKPLVTGALVRLSGFCVGYLIGEKRPVTDEFVRAIRIEQRNALRSLFFMKPLKDTTPRAMARDAAPEYSEEVPSDAMSHR
jgi:biofilm PGA synthesis N-glycosyltransferase PgaC